MGSHEKKPSVRQPIGDPDNHDLAVIFEPTKLGCAGLIALELAVGVGGTLLLKNSLPEGDRLRLTKHGLDLLAIWGAAPAAYVSGGIWWACHMDYAHYDRYREHNHLIAEALKAPLYAVRSFREWKDRRFNR